MTAMNTSLLRLPAVMEATGLKRATLYLRIKQKLLTTPVKIGERCSAWPCHEIEAINAARIAGKDEAEIRDLVEELHKQRMAK